MSKRIQDVEEGDRLWVALDDHGKKDQFVVVKVYDFNFMTRTVRLGYRYTSDHAGVEPFESRFSWDDLEYVETPTVEVVWHPFKQGDRVSDGQGVEFVVGLADYDRAGLFWVAGFDDDGAFRYGVFSDSWKLVVPEVVRWANTYNRGIAVYWYSTREKAEEAAGELAGDDRPLGVIEHNVTKNTVTYHPVVKS